MANPGYVRSTDGDDADDGSTWALANATLAGAAADDAAGDTIYFSQNHSENGAAIISVTIGTNAAPSKLIGANDGAEPPTAVATSAVIATNGAYNITIDGSLYAYGLTIRTGNGGAVNSRITLASDAGDIQRWEDCVFDVNSSGTSAYLALGVGGNVQPQEMYWKDCDVDFVGANNYIYAFGVYFRWDGGSFLSGTASPNGAVFELNSLGERAVILVTGVDLSNLSSTVTLVSTSGGAGNVVFRNCKLPSSWTGSLINTSAIGTRVELRNCDSSDTNYRLWVEDYAGSIKHETTLVKDSGASDGTTSLSWKMVTSADAEYPAIQLVSPEIQQWNETVGSSITVTVDMLWDSATAIQNDEVWLEVEYLGTAGFPLSLFIDDAAADVLATPADQTVSSATWTTTGMSNPDERQLSVSFTPQEKGLIIARIHLAKASTTIYVDPLLTVS